MKKAKFNHKTSSDKVGNYLIRKGSEFTWICEVNGSFKS